MEALERLVTQTILPFTRKNKYTLVGLSYWANPEDYCYAPIIVGSDDLLSLAVHGIDQTVSESQRKFVDNFHKSPKIVGTAILRRASDDEHNEAACKTLLRYLGEYSLTSKVTPPVFVPKGQQPAESCNYPV